MHRNKEVIIRFFTTFIITCCFFLTACTGGSDTATLDPGKADTVQPAQTGAVSDEIRLAVGTPSAAVISLLGPADNAETMDNGRQMWRYSGKSAEYIYFSNADNVQTLVIGKYSRTGTGPGLPFLLTVVLDPAGKVIDFNFSQLKL